MTSTSKCEYAELESDCSSSSTAAEVPFLTPRKRNNRRKWALIAICLISFEGLHLLVLRLAYVSLRAHIESNWPKAAPNIDGLAELTKYNTTVTYTNDNTLVEASDFADHFWATYTPHSAVVAVNVRVAKEEGIPESVISPTNPEQMLYQVDGFHELHCLYRLRRILIGAATRNDHAHTLHCLNYIRQTLMCNMDFTLGSSDDLQNYGLKDKRQCRDYNAILAWVERNKWKDFESWQTAKSKNHWDIIISGH